MANMIVQDYAGVTVVTINDSTLTDSVKITSMAEELYALADEQNKQKLILDFSNVRFLASQTLGVIITLNKKMQSIKGMLALCGLRDDLMKVFTITKLDKLLKFYRNDAEALKSFNVHVRA